MGTGIKKTVDGYQAWFKIDNQTFHLEEHIEDTDKDSLEVAEFFERMLKVAFLKLDIHNVSEPLDDLKEWCHNTCNESNSDELHEILERLNAR